MDGCSLSLIDVSDCSSRHPAPVAGGCPVLNAAVDEDDGNVVLRPHVTKRLSFWLEGVQKFAEALIISRAAKDHRAAETGTATPESLPRYRSPTLHETYLRDQAPNGSGMPGIRLARNRTTTAWAKLNRSVT
jgi:hypothetical protein